MQMGMCTVQTDTPLHPTLFPFTMILDAWERIPPDHGLRSGSQQYLLYLGGLPEGREPGDVSAPPTGWGPAGDWDRPRSVCADLGRARAAHSAVLWNACLTCSRTHRRGRGVGYSPRHVLDERKLKKEKRERESVDEKEQKVIERERERGEKNNKSSCQ